MNQKLNVRALKGAPLSILIVLMTQRQTVSHAYLCSETGYSDKSVTAGLNYLVSNQIVTRIGHSGFCLTDGSYQLPLYWDEKIEPADPSPALFLGETQEKLEEAQNFSRKNSDSEIAEVGKFTTLEKRVEALESEILRLKWQMQHQNTAEVGEIPAEIGEISDDIKSSSSINPDKDTNQNDDDAEYSRKFSDICNEYRNGYHFDRDGMIEYSGDDLKKLERLHGDLEIWEFVVSRAKSVETAEKWLRMDMQQAKSALCDQFGIKATMKKNIVDTPDVNLFEIDYHYWHWRLCESDNPRITLGTVGFRIMNHFDNERANHSLPKICGYLE